MQPDDIFASISMEKGAEKLGISVEKLKDDMVKAGYNV